ncbi:putative kinase [Escherichia coli 3-475-03_S3_C1]|nr:carbohydrate kinase, fggy family protein [Escherichia coli DEC13A]EHX59649.1 carbohydrate kinase, fggy family protein [Escherichia coli DEC13C]END31637.1 putative kinase [Escherichia coli 179100]KEK79717.1 putative kinase [Escherichia coli 3-475-03_S3_C1]GJI11239.1 hypothetical protein ECZC14_28770 [Escherichia coli]
MEDDCDIIIIGAGIAGTACALRMDISFDTGKRGSDAEEQLRQYA